MAQRDANAQRVRLRHAAMTIAPYMCNVAFLVACWQMGALAGAHVLQYFAAVSLLIGIFVALYASGWNRRFDDATLTMAHIMLAPLPGLYVMFHMSDLGARGAFVVLAFVPLIFGALALNLRRFVFVALYYVVGYGTMMWLLYRYHPEQTTPRGDLLFGLALLGGVLQVAYVGGFVFELREKLRKRSRELGAALEKISEMAARDELTAAFNRRHLLQVLDTEMARSTRDEDALAVCIIDVDHFKRVNDSHGHTVGDEVLRRVAQQLTPALRSSDALGRYGGEEFILVMPQTSAGGALTKAERVRSSIEALDLSDLAPQLRVTVSVGVAIWESPQTLVELINCADRALYAAKRQGRNRVVFDDDTVRVLAG